MNKSVLMQKQVKDNAEDLQKEFLDMKNWEERMKHRDEELRKGASGQTTLPPVRNKQKSKTKNNSNKQNETDTKSKRIKSYDYSTWDKFDVDKACEDVDKEEQSGESEGETMSKEQLEKAHQEATKHKNAGNILVQQQKWSKAVGCYNEAIKIFPYDAVFYANRALCQLKLDNFFSAESDCSAAIQLDETYVKAYHRRATARMNLKQYKEAKTDLEKVLKLDTSNKEAKSLLIQVEQKINCSKTAIVLNEDIEKSLEKSTIEKRIGDKIWNNAVSSVPTTDTKNVVDTKHMKENKDSKNIMNSKLNTEDSQVSVEETATGENKNPRIPDWLPEKDDVAIIEPIVKPAHLRSKKLLTRVPVEEVDFASMQCNRDSNKPPNQIDSKQKEEVPKVVKKKKSKVVKTRRTIKFSEPSEDVSIIPPVPKTAVQFLMTWKACKSSEFRYKYLEQLPGNSISKIFQDSMESYIFGEILDVLRIEFINRNTPIFCYLKDLSEVRRFRALVMFISSKDKKNIKGLLEYCELVENVPEDDILSLRKRYEL